jgi:hypothetical protein
LTERAPQRILDGGDARRADRGSQVRDGSQADGGETRRFELALCQSNGPAANRSGRDQHNHVRHVLPQIANHRRYGFP